MRALVVYGRHDSTAPVTAALCRGCAVLLTPLRIGIDLGRTEAVTDLDATCREVDEFVRRVLVMRAEPPTDVVWTRARDIHVLARQLATTRTHLVLRLGDLGVLAAIEVATTRPSGTARQARDARRALRTTSTETMS